MNVIEKIVTRKFSDDGYWLPPDEERPLVRCKDCFYGEVEPDDNSYFFCTHPLHKLESHESSYFCADGERKDS